MSARRLSNGFDFDGTLHALRRNIALADALITAAENLIEQSWKSTPCENEDEGDDLGVDGLGRRRSHVEYLVEAAKLAVRNAMRAGIQLDLHRRSV